MDQEHVVKRTVERLGTLRPRVLRGSDLRFIFDLYDRLVFDFQVSKRVEELKAQLKFKASGRISGITSLVGIESASPLTYYIDFAPNVFSKTAPFQIDLLTKIIANQMIHLIMICWELSGNRPAYFSEGLLFRKLRDRYLGNEFILEKGLIRLDLESPQRYRTPFSCFPGLLSYQENSCYIDSLLMILFLSEPDIYRKSLLDIQVSQIKTRDPKLVTRGSSMTKKEVQRRTSELQKVLQFVYFSLVQEKQFRTSEPIRDVLSEFYSDLKRGEKYNVSAVYDLFTEVFPHLKIRSIPVYIKLEDQKPRRVTRDLTLFQFWDFLGSSTTGEEVDWEEIDAPLLVFQNGGLPLQNYGSSSPELVDGEMYFKTRWFGETILDGKYRLFGAIVLHDVHYTSFIRLKGDQWCHYNDIGPSLVYINGTPQDVFFEIHGRRPELYFYYREPSPSLQIRTVQRPERKTIILAKDRGCSELQKRQVRQLSPHQYRDPKTWVWIVHPAESQRIVERLNEIKAKD